MDNSHYLGGSNIGRHVLVYVVALCANPLQSGLDTPIQQRNSIVAENYRLHRRLVIWMDVVAS